MMQYALARMTVTFEAVPKERLDWTPSPTSKSALQIVSHCVDANRGVARVLKGEANSAFPDWSFRLGGKEEALAALAQSVAEYEAGLDAMTPERWDDLAESPGGSLPLSVWMHFIGHHMAEHAAQVDYLQTCWDDQESRYPNG